MSPTCTGHTHLLTCLAHLAHWPGLTLLYPPPQLPQLTTQAPPDVSKAPAHPLSPFPLPHSHLLLLIAPLTCNPLLTSPTLYLLTPPHPLLSSHTLPAGTSSSTCSLPLSPASPPAPPPALTHAPILTHTAPLSTHPAPASSLPSLTTPPGHFPSHSSPTHPLSSHSLGLCHPPQSCG